MKIKLAEAQKNTKWLADNCQACSPRCEHYDEVKNAFTTGEIGHKALKFIGFKGYLSPAVASGTMNADCQNKNRNKAKAPRQDLNLKLF